MFPILLSMQHFYQIVSFSLQQQNSSLILMCSTTYGSQSSGTQRLGKQLKSKQGFYQNYKTNACMKTVLLLPGQGLHVECALTWWTGRCPPLPQPWAALAGSECRWRSQYDPHHHCVCVCSGSVYCVGVHREYQMHCNLWNFESTVSVVWGCNSCNTIADI